MRYRSKFLIAAGLAAAVLSSPATQAADLVVATDTAFVPFEFKQGDKYVGFDIDLWDAIAQDIGVAYTLQPMDFNGIIPALQTGQVDVALAGITIKDERQKVIDFSDGRSEEHTSELQSLMRSSYAVFCLKKKKT